MQAYALLGNSWPNKPTVPGVCCQVKKDIEPQDANTVSVEGHLWLKMWLTDLLQAVILWQSPCVSIAVNGDLHGSSLTHDTVCHNEISARQHQTLTHKDGLMFVI